MARQISSIHFVDAVTIGVQTASSVSAEKSKLPMAEDAIGVIVGNERIPWSNVKQVRYAAEPAKAKP